MDSAQVNSLDAFWMPFTSNRRFKQAPRLFVGAEGMHYRTADGRTLLDSTAGLWCVNAGHGRKPIVEAIQAQAAEMDFAPPFQMGHPRAFEAASRVAALMPPGLDHVFFTNSGSESVDTALKIALAYHRLRGEGQRTRLIGREKGYHGVNMGGVSVSGLPLNRRLFGPLLPGTDYLPHTHDPARNAFSRGQPAHGAERADALLGILAVHDPSTVAAVIVEPVSGSAGVYVPPVGYLERLAEHCRAHGILLIFDEVITGFGRLGYATAAERFGVTPDLITLAKGLTNGAVPMGAVAVRDTVHEVFMQGPESGIELPHGYTYSGHPLACAAAIASIDLYREEDMFARALALAPHFEAAVHSLRGRPHVVDIRNLGLVAGVELAARDGAPGARGYDTLLACYERGLLIRVTGDIIAISPPLIASPEQLTEMVAIIADALGEVA